MTQSGLRQRRANTLIAVLTGTAVTMVLLALVTSQLIREVWQLQSSSARQLLGQAEVLRAEGNEIIRSLNRLDATTCSDDLLTQMRKALFFSSHIRDIGYVRQGNLICSTGRGVLDTPLPQPEPDYVSVYDFKVWGRANVEVFGQTIRAPMAEKGNFNVVYDDSTFTGVLSAPYRWQLAYREGDRIESVLGTENTFRPPFGADTQAVSLRSHYYARCSEQFPYCIAIEVRNGPLALAHSGLLILLFCTCLVAGATTGFLTANILRQRTSAGNRVRRGLKSGHFYPLFQPIVDLQSGRIIGCEVLARFSDRMGPLYPDQFIPLVADMGLSWPFTRIITRQAVRSLEAFAAIPDGFAVNINLFPGDIASGKVRDLGNVSAWKETRLQLNFEITEDQQLDTRAALDSLHWIREQHWGLAVDDFGTGYSNLSQIRDLNCNTLKIDRSFVTDIEHGGVRAAIVPIVVQLAEELELKVVAEGIENEVQWDIIRGLGIAYGQGWLFGKPMDAEALASLMAVPASDGLTQDREQPLHSSH